MPNASLSINQACCWALFLFHFSFFCLVYHHSSHLRLLCNASFDVLSLTSHFSCTIKPTQRKRGTKRNWGGGGTEVRSVYIKTSPRLLLLMFEPQSRVFFISMIKACIMVEEVIRLLSSGCGTGQQGPN